MFFYLVTIVSSVVRRFSTELGVGGSRWIFSAMSKLNIIIGGCWLLAVLIKKNRRHEEKATDFDLIWLLPLVLVGIGIYFLKLESVNYPNYLYTHFGLDKDFVIKNLAINLLLLLFYCSVTIFNLIKLLTKKYISFGWSFRIKLSDWQLWLVLVSVSYLLFQSFNHNQLLDYRFLTYKAVLGQDTEYIEVMENLNNDCPIIHPPYDMKLPDETRWPNLRNQPILQFFLYPRTLINGEAFTDKKYLNKIKDFRCFYFPKITIKGQEWPMVVDDKVSFDRYNKNFIPLKINKIIGNGEVKIYKVELNL